MFALAFEVPPVTRTFLLLWIFRYYAHAEKHDMRSFHEIVGDEIHVFALTAFGGLVAIAITSWRSARTSRIAPGLPSS